MTGTNGSVFLLGGGLMQLPMIAEAKRMGFVCHLADGNADCPGREHVEVFHHVDLRDTEGLLEVARGIPGLKGVFTAGTDFSRSVAHVAEHLGLPGITRTIAERATDKGLMRSTLSCNGVKVPRFLVHETDEVPVPEFPPPWVIKPVDNMGARGVILVESPEDLPGAVLSAMGYARAGRVIIEEFISGDEYSIDALVYDGEVRITGIGARHIFFRPRFVELGHTIPATLKEPEYAALVDTFTAAVRAIGIDRGAAKGDVFLDHDDAGEPFATIGEIAARLSGGFMSGWTFPLATGIPLTRLGLEVAIGMSPDRERFVPAHHLVCAERALISAPGTVAAVESGVSAKPGLYEPTQPRDRIGIREVFINCAPGDRVVPPRNNVEKVANVIALGKTVEEASRIAADALDRIVIVLDPGDSESDAFFFRNGWNDLYARYRVSSSCGTRSVIGIDGISDTHISDAAVDPVVVRSLEELGGTLGDLENNQISIPAEELVDRLVTEGALRFAPDAGVEVSILFWRSLIAGGRQGVRYFVDTLRDRGRHDG
jgi:biotin carboxylase